MTNAEIIQAIRNEIERQIALLPTVGYSTQIAGDYIPVQNTLNYLLSFLSTLESEKPMQEELEEAIVDYFEGYWPGMETAEQCNTDLHFTPPAIMRLASHFAQWQKEQDEKELSDLLTIAHLQGADQMKEQMMKEAVKWLVDDDYDELTDKGRFILGSAGLGYNGYYIPYSDLLKLPKEDGK